MPLPIIVKAKHVHAISGNEHLDGTWITGYLSDAMYINSPRLQGEFLIEPKTISQFTGKFDDTKWDELPKETQQEFVRSLSALVSDWKGFPIFENDKVLVTFTDGSSEETFVTYDESHAGFTPWVWQYQCDGCDTELIIKSVKIIGNRFDEDESPVPHYVFPYSKKKFIQKPEKP